MYDQLKTEVKMRFPEKLGWSKCSSRIDLAILFKTGFSNFIKKLSLKSNLNLLELDAKVSKSSKVIGGLHRNRWSHTSNFLVFLKLFPIRFEFRLFSDVLVKNV